jgi:hypothetical protein
MNILKQIWPKYTFKSYKFRQPREVFNSILKNRKTPYSGPGTTSVFKVIPGPKFSPKIFETFLGPWKVRTSKKKQKGFARYQIRGLPVSVNRKNTIIDF